MLLPKRPHPLVFLKQFYQLQAKYSNICDYEGHFQLNHHKGQTTKKFEGVSVKVIVKCDMKEKTLWFPVLTY